MMKTISSHLVASKAWVEVGIKGLVKTANNKMIPSEALEALVDSEDLVALAEALVDLENKMISLEEVEMDSLQSSLVFHREGQAQPQLKLRLSFRMDKRSLEQRRPLLIETAIKEQKSLRISTKAMAEERDILTS